MQEAVRAEASGGPVTVTPSEGLDQQGPILGMIATGAPLSETLLRIAKRVEEAVPGARATILLLERGRLFHAAAPSLPASYTRAVDGALDAPGASPSGTNAFTGKPVRIEDIGTHPDWTPLRELARAHGLRACWRAPILGRSDELLGAIAIYEQGPGGPRPEGERLVAEAQRLASIAIQHDRFARVDAERLAESRERVVFRELLRNAPIPVSLLVGPEFTYEFVNQAAELLSGRRDLEGRRVIDVFPELEAQGLLALLRSIYESGQPYDDPELHVRIDRGRGPEDCWFAIRIEPYRDASGKVQGLLSVGLEVTAQVRTRQELDARRSEIALREKMSALGQLVSGVAHEIRTPLTYLATNLNLIQLRLERHIGSLSPEQADANRMLIEQYIPSALEATDRINHIVEDLREFTQLQPGTRERSDLAQVVRQAVNLFQVTHRGRIDVSLETAAQPALEVDKLQIQQAVLNLLQNAMEAEPGDNTIRVFVTADAAHARIEVADRGRGIPAQARPRVFDPFFTTRPGGTGLGLSIVKRVVEEHRGSVSFETGPEGTTFRLLLPLKAEEA